MDAFGVLLIRTDRSKRAGTDVLRAAILYSLSLCVLEISLLSRACRFLCLKNKTSALVVFTTYTQKHPSIERGPPFVQPLLNFLWFLLLAVDGYECLISSNMFLYGCFHVCCLQKNLRTEHFFCADVEKLIASMADLTDLASLLLVCSRVKRALEDSKQKAEM